MGTQAMITRFLVLLVFFGFIQCRSVQNLTCDQIHQFVDGHNLRRQKLLLGQVPGQPAASEMNIMVWDEEIAAKAAKWASKFRKRRHNPNRTLKSKRFRTGENLAWFEATYEPDVIAMALDAWFNEYEDFTYGPITWAHFQGSKQVAHYTQMAWSDTIYIGCALYKRRWWKMIHFSIVCNYGKAGNVISQTPYKSGKPGKTLTCKADDCDHRYGHC